jgi:hypothetical protein
VAGEDGLVRDVFGNHRFAEALRRDQDDVAGALEKFETQCRLDGVAIDLLGPGPIVIGHRFESTDATTREAPLEAAARPLVELDASDVLEELGRAPAFFGGERDQIVELGSGQAQTDGGELLSQWGHRRPPWCGCRARRREPARGA